MSELQFKSSLTMDEIEENFKNIDFFAGIMDGLQEAVTFKKETPPRIPFIDTNVVNET